MSSESSAALNAEGSILEASVALFEWPSPGSEDNPTLGDRVGDAAAQVSLTAMGKPEPYQYHSLEAGRTIR